MDRESLMTTMRNDFNESSHVLRAHKDSLSRIEDQIAILNRNPQNEGRDRFMEILLGLASEYREYVQDYREHVVDLYQAAIEEDLDLDGSRLLKVYRFIYRNAEQIHRQLALIDVPNNSNAVWGIIILVAIMYLYAAV
ncbi:hypothetical protein CAEBREN_07410 [Caenorhabditis brenneri]|uniref:Uncharacterized protein n=1 Tax=Caenorhabditis brenneri TaxID=135651 RepID=G0MNC7_CAEBE|nr:hypothetical protein CAEBREN_07410 [Caenorhabditis brenneri]